MDPAIHRPLGEVLDIRKAEGSGSAQSAPDLAQNSEIFGSDDSDEYPEPVSKPVPKPMNDPVTTRWELPISDTDYEKLLKGFTPQDMDDKWSIHSENLDDGRGIKVTIGRGRFGMRHYLLYITRRNDDSGWMIEWMTWEQSMGNVIFVSEEQGKDRAIVLCRSALECDLEAFPYVEIYLYEDVLISNVTFNDGDYLTQKNRYFANLNKNGIS